jgi:hypothetical protein
MSYQQRKIITDSKRKNAIVSSLFPATVRDKLMSTDLVDENESYHEKQKGSKQGNGPLSDHVNRPIAELYTDTTVLFAGKPDRRELLLFLH